MKAIHQLFVAGLLALAAIFTSTPVLAQPDEDIIGQWDFDAEYAATIGDALAPRGDTQSRTMFGTTASLGIPQINGTNASVMMFPANDATQGYDMGFFTGGNGGGFNVNQWTILFDVLYPSTSDNVFRSLVETDLRNIAPDAEFQINAAGGIGGNGSFDGQILANTWYRIGFVVDTPNNVIRKYINGTLVGTMSATSGATPALDGRWALLVNDSRAEIFNDDNGQTAPGYVNAIQLRDAALTSPQMRAMGGPSAVGIPQVIPPVPSFVESWIPSGTLALANTDVGAVIFDGDSTVSAIELRLDGVLQSNPVITPSGDLITVRKTPAAPLAIASKHVVQITYREDLAGVMRVVTQTNQFEVAVFLEDFNGLVLGPNVDEGVAGTQVWTKTAPADWTIDDSGVPGAGDPGNDGVTEWAGWSFANRDWWATTAGNQRRAEFTKAAGAVAVFDPDEWDDAGHAAGMLNSWLATPDISLAGVAPNTAILKLDTSWRDECCDDNASLTNDQTFLIYVQYDGGASNVVLHWSSNPADPNFRNDEPNGTHVIPLNNPAGATSMKLSFGGLYSENDWWVAFDNVQIVASTLPPSITTEPAGDLVSAGANVTLFVVASSQAPLSYQWQFNGGDLTGATSSNLFLANIQQANAGNYRVIVSNSAGSVTSKVARVEVFSGTITQDLVTHLKFDGDFNDSSTRGNNGAGGVSGTPTFVPGRVGTEAMHIGSDPAYATLGAPADLNFGTSTDFSISFWARMVSWSGDPSLVGNKDWNSGSNPGYVIFTDSGGPLALNLAQPSPANRKDVSVAQGAFGTSTAGDNVWHHVAVTFDRNGNASLYLDGAKRGVLDLSVSENNLDTPVGFATNIGQDGTGSYGPKFSNADFDDLGIWRRVITPQEIASIYGQGLMGMDLSTATGVPPALPPTITTQPASRLVSVGGSATFSVVASGDGTLGYQWQKNGGNVGGATAASLTINPAQAADAGNYRVIVSNAGGSVTSAPVVLQVFAGATSQDLVAWLRFEGNYADSSGHGNNGTPVGSPSLVPGKVGQGLFFKTTADGSVINYVTLGYPPDLQFGTGDFSVGFWISYTNQVDDPPFIASQNWDSSNNTGWGLYSQGGANFRVVVTGNQGSRMNTTATPAIRNTGWRHIVMSCWRNQVTSIYVDGVLANTTPLTIAGSVDTFSLGQSVNIGQDGRGTYTDGGSAAIEGYIDEVQLWRRALTAQDASAVYAAGAAGQSSFVTITSIRSNGPNVALTWYGGNGPWTVQRKTNLADAEWTDVITTNTLSAEVPAPGSSGFYRVVNRVNFAVALSGANERPTPINPAGTGSGTVTLDGNKVTVNVTYTGMTSAVNNAHIHGPATTEQSAGPLLGLTHTGGTSGTVTGTATMTALNVQRILDGLTYVNIHTANNGSGEIRGQILRAP